MHDDGGDESSDGVVMDDTMLVARWRGVDNARQQPKTTLSLALKKNVDITPVI